MGLRLALVVGINNDPDNPALFDYIGNFFTTGNKPRQVTHLGYWDDSGIGHERRARCRLVSGHQFGGVGLCPARVGSVSAYGWRWVPLAHPVTLLPNTTYSIFGDTNGLDSWPNAFMPSWNTAYVGTNAASAYLSWSWDNPFAFPEYPSSGHLQGNGGWNAGSALGQRQPRQFPDGFESPTRSTGLWARLNRPPMSPAHTRRFPEPPVPIPCR